MRLAEGDRFVEGDGVAARLEASDPDAAGAILGGCPNQCFNCCVQALVDLVCAGEHQMKTCIASSLSFFGTADAGSLIRG